MLLNAKKCLNVLETRLIKSGGLLDANNYEEVDATLYAYIATVTRMLAPTNALRAHLQECPKLMEFMHKFQSTFLAANDGDENTTYVTLQEESKLGSPAVGIADFDDDKFFAKKMPIILSTIIAAGAMLLFAKKQRIFEVSGKAFILVLESNNKLILMIFASDKRTFASHGLRR